MSLSVPVAKGDDDTEQPKSAPYRKSLSSLLSTPPVGGRPRSRSHSQRNRSLSPSPPQRNRRNGNDNEKGPMSRIQQKLVHAVEFYFSNQHMWQDVKMAQHMANGRGFIPLSFIAECEKVAEVSIDPTMIIAAIHRSSKIALNEAQTHVRRTTSLPAFDSMRNDSTTLFVDNLPAKSTLKSVKKLFSIFGKVTFVYRADRIALIGQTPLPTLATRYAPQKGAVINEETFTAAFVQFDNAEMATAAMSAVLAINNNNDIMHTAAVEELKKSPQMKAFVARSSPNVHAATASVHTITLLDPMPELTLETGDSSASNTSEHRGSFTTNIIPPTPTAATSSTANSSSSSTPSTTPSTSPSPSPPLPEPITAANSAPKLSAEQTAAFEHMYIASKAAYLSQQRILYERIGKPKSDVIKADVFDSNRSNWRADVSNPPAPADHSHSNGHSSNGHGPIIHIAPLTSNKAESAPHSPLTDHDDVAPLTDNKKKKYKKNRNKSSDSADGTETLPGPPVGRFSLTKPSAQTQTVSRFALGPESNDARGFKARKQSLLNANAADITSAANGSQ